MSADCRFSFIIPHYDIPELLQRCISTIPQRPDIQILIVDDMSPEYDSYPERFPFLFRTGIQWIRAPRHSGAGYARNLGLRLAEGEWILFADADVFFTEDLSTFLDDNQDASEDVLYFRNRCVLSDHTPMTLFSAPSLQAKRSRLELLTITSMS